LSQEKLRAPGQALSGAVLALFAAGATAQSAPAPDAAANRLNDLRQRIEAQTRELGALKRALADQEASLNEMRRALGSEALASQRGGTAAAASQQVAQAPVPAAPAAPAVEPGGQRPDEASQRPAVAPIFEQPGVLTPRGKFVLEPSIQYSYSSSNRIALVGYTVIPAILVGLIDIRDVRRNTATAALTGRFGVTNRFEIEAKLPYVYRADTGVGREFLEGAATDSRVFDSNGKGLGDIEVTGRYQFNDGGLDSPYYIGSLRFKSRTGKDPFEVKTSKNVVGFRNDGIQVELPTGSGFYGLQGAVTALYPSDPAVFFGTVSYLHTFSRDNVSRRIVDGPPETIGKVAPGGIFGFNFGMGLGLNEKSSFSIGYDHASVGKTKIDGKAGADSVRVQLGTLLLGYSYRLGDKRTLNVSLGAGLTRDTPDLTLTVRTPMSF
jgi:hypothetical protein